MSEKNFTARIALKIDTLENWNKSTLPLKKGELALVEVTGTDLTESIIMAKVGEDGVKTFKDLDWNFYALASDVLEACKSEEALTAFINNVVGSNNIATNEDFIALSDRVSAAESDIDVLQSLVGDTSVAAQITDAINQLNSDDVGIYVQDTEPTDAVDGDIWIDPSTEAGAYATLEHGHAIATTSTAGFMSAADKTKLDGISELGSGDYILPTATSVTLGGVKTGDNITNTNGVISMTKNNVTSALGYVPSSKDELNNLSELVGDTSVSEQISNAVANKADADSYLPLSGGGDVVGSIQLSNDYNNGHGQIKKNNSSTVDGGFYIRDYDKDGNYTTIRAQGWANKVQVSYDSEQTWREILTTILPSNTYGDTLPSPGIPGRIFFKKVAE